MPELVRVYVPLDARQVRELADTGRLGTPVDGLTASGGTEAEAEEREHAAVQRTARVALESGRPVLLAAADVDAARVAVRDGDDGTELTAVDPEGVVVVTVSGEILLTRVAALLVGDDVLGSEPALGDREQIELSWYDTTELDHLVGLL